MSRMATMQVLNDAFKTANAAFDAYTRNKNEERRMELANKMAILDREYREKLQSAYNHYATDIVHSSAISEVSIYKREEHSSLDTDTNTGQLESSSFVDEKLAQFLTSVNKKDVSKVVDENGEPLVVYHGTDTGGFTEFDTDGKGGSKDTGAWFSDNWRIADTYTKIGDELELLTTFRDLDDKGLIDTRYVIKNANGEIEKDTINRSKESIEKDYELLDGDEIVEYYELFNMDGYAISLYLQTKGEIDDILGYREDRLIAELDGEMRYINEEKARHLRESRQLHVKTPDASVRPDEPSLSPASIYSRPSQAKYSEKLEAAMDEAEEMFDGKKDKVVYSR